MTDWQKVEALYCMFTGTPGTRKSTQALSFPGPQYWLSWDRKMNSLVLPASKWGINLREKVKFDNLSDWSSGRAKLEALISPSDSLVVKPFPYKTLVVDSIASTADSTLRQTLQAKSGVTRASGSKAGKMVAGIAVNEIEDYNAESSALSELIALTKDIHEMHKCNVILIAHLIQAEYKSSPNAPANVVRTIVTAGKRIAPKIPAYCDEVYHFFVQPSIVATEEGTYSILTRPNENDFARTMLPLDRILPVGEQPLYPTFIKPALDQLNQNL